MRPTGGPLPGGETRVYAPTGARLRDVDALVAQLATETDEKKRKQLAFDFQTLAVTDLPIIPLVEFDSYTIARNRVRGHSDWANYIGESWADLWVSE